MSLFKKLFAAASTVAMLAAGLAPATALAVAHGPGSVVKDSSGTVWFITKDNQRRAFTSAGAFMTYGFLSFAQVVDANADDLALPAGAFIPPRDGSIFCATMTKGTDVAGECALITGGMKAAFTSAAVFAAQGHTFARAQYGDSSFLQKTSNIDNGAAQHRMGVLINNGGTVQLVGTNSLLGIPSIDVFNSWGYSFADVVPANAADVTLPQNGVMCARVPGELNPSFTGSCSQVPPPSQGEADCDDLQGNAGSVTIDQDSTFSNEEVGESEEEVGILGFEVEADDDSDVAVTSVKVLFFQEDTDVSQDLEDYVSEVQIMHGDDVVGTADADEFTEDSDVFTKNISLDCAAVAAGETGDFSVAVTAQDNLDSADIADENWNVSLQQLRFEDADGVTTTENVSDDDTTFGEAGEIDETFDFVDFQTAADVELHVALNDDDEDINEAHNVVVEDDEDTDDVELLSFTLEAEGDSDINVDEIPVTITTDDNDLDTVISSADLYHDGTLVDSQNVSDTVPDGEVTVVFEDLDIDINAGDTENFMVKVNALELENNYAQGTTLTAEVETADIEAEDEEGDDLSGSSELTGSAIGEEVSLFSEGITVEVNSAETDVDSNDGATNDTVQFTWDVTITNIGDDDVYINGDNDFVVDADGADPAVDIVYAFEDNAATLINDSGTITDTSSAVEVTGGGDYTGQNFFKISSGGSEDFTITVTATNSVAAAQVRAMLTNIQWTTDDVSSFAGAETVNDYTANLSEDSETPFRLVN